MNEWCAEKNLLSHSITWNWILPKEKSRLSKPNPVFFHILSEIKT